MLELAEISGCGFARKKNDLSWRDIELCTAEKRSLAVFPRVKMKTYPKAHILLLTLYKTPEKTGHAFSLISPFSYEFDG